MKTTTALGAFVLAVILAAGDPPSTLDAELACETAREMVRLQAQPLPAPPQAHPGQVRPLQRHRQGEKRGRNRRDPLP